MALLAPVLRRLLAAPGNFFAALWLALRTGWRGTRPLPYHLVYFVEACNLVGHLEEFGARHVHAHFGTNSTAVVMLARALGGPPYSFTVHGPEEFDDPVGLRLDEKAKHAAFVVAITSYARAQLCRWVDPVYWHKIKVVHCGLEDDSFAMEDVAPPDGSTFVCIGRLNEQKGQLLLLEAARVLQERGRQFRIVLIGDGELRNTLETAIREHGLHEQVTLTGSLSGAQVRAELANCRALVLPSFAEGLPIVIMEALAAGRPVLTTYVAGIPELVRPGENGWLIPPGSLDELVTAMEAVLDCPAETLAAMGAQGRERVRERHSAATEAARLAGYIRDSA